MIPFNEAVQIVLDSSRILQAEEVPLLEALGRILFNDVTSDIDIPPFNKSAMDGYAYKGIDSDTPLKLVETIPAGYYPKKTVKRGECSKIMTGGVVPEGADTVVMIEHTKCSDEFVTITEKSSKKNICYKAENVKKGDTVLEKGTLLTPAEIAMLASVGCDPVSVVRRPVIGIIPTGNELVEPSEIPKQAQIRNSNGYQLYHQVLQAGCIPHYCGIIKDTPEALREIIDREFNNFDIFLFSGGVSMGDYDYVPDVLKEKGFSLLFQKVAIKPGKPNVFGKKEDTYVFGLPGNPVSTLISFELFVKPLCYKLMGNSYKPKIVTGSLKKTMFRKKSNRINHIPVYLDDEGKVSSLSYKGSGHIHAFCKANGFITIPIGIKEIKAGELVKVTLIK
ncbi:MAG: molybdopterin molybdotransferase MoeA [Chitinispirillia bacterium]|jgi:molybdopterin molybdotransferase